MPAKAKSKPAPTINTPLLLSPAALHAVSNFSAILGRPYVMREGDNTGVAWGSEDGQSFIATLIWAGNRLTATISAFGEREWQVAYGVIGYCTHHGIPFHIVYRDPEGA